MADPVLALPIDIAYNKLADWLVDRRKVPPDWRKKLATVHTRVALALSTLPRNADPRFLNMTSDCTGYLEAKYIRDVLLTARPESRNLFGRLTGSTAEWDAIVSAYEKDLIFLGEAAQIMVQSTNYDIPYQKKQIAKLQQQLSDSERKESEVKRNAIQSATKYQQACQELGIPGVAVRAELLALGKSLPTIFADALEALCGSLIGSALEYYQAFISYAHAAQVDGSSPVLPTLTEVRIHPPDVHADIRQFPSLAESPSRKQVQSGSQPDVDTIEIDWGLEAGDAETSMQSDIDWDIGALDIQDSSAGEMNLLHLGEEKNNEMKEFEVSAEDIQVEDRELAPGIVWDVEVPTEIDWDIDVQEDGLVSTPSLPDIKLGINDIEQEHVAGRKGGPPNWFAETENRNRLLDDLCELKAFLKQRLQELESGEISSLQNQVQAVAPSSIPQHGSESLMAMASSVAQVLNLLTNRKARDLILISTSVRYLERLEATLTQKKQNEFKLEQNIKDLASKRLELLNFQASLRPKQEELLTRTQAVKQHVERVLSGHYDGRKVNIIGEINTLLGQT